MNIKEKRVKAIKLKALNKAIAGYPNKIEVRSEHDEVSLMNNKCHFNAVNMVKTGRAVAVVECVLIESDGCVAHYINLLSDGSYIDYTLGWAWSGGDYRFSKIIHEKDYHLINNKLSHLKEKICSQFITKIDSMIGIDKWDIC